MRSASETSGTRRADLREPPFLWLEQLSSFPVSVLLWAEGAGEAGEGAGGAGAALARASAEDGCARGGAGIARAEVLEGEGGIAGAVLTLSLPFVEVVGGWRSGQTG